MHLPPPTVRRLRIAFRVGMALTAVALVYLARVRPSWPWFSLWLFALVAAFAVLQLPRVRATLNLSWFRLSLLTLFGVGLFNLFLFQVEIHRQRSERLEVRGVYFDASQDRVRVGVGRPALDARLEGSLYAFDRWSVDLRAVGGSEFVLERPRQVDMVRVRTGGWRIPGLPSTRPALGVELSGRSPEIVHEVGPGDTTRLSLEREGLRGELLWDGRRAPLSVELGVRDRRLSRKLSAGIPLAELAWDSAPRRGLAEDLVLTRVRRGRALGRLRLALPEYRLASRSDATAWEEDARLALQAGDTVWITSRGKTWAFAVDRVPGVSRVAAPIAVLFVQRPRPSGWALPSPEACGRDSDRCAVLSTRRLPPPQAHFDVGAFGLDTARYSLLARVETEPDRVRLVGARGALDFAYGEVQAVPARGLDSDQAGAGLLVRVHRSDRGQLGDVLLTVLGLYALMLGALLVVSGDVRLWQARRAHSPHVATAWALANVFLIFLGVRLALGLRVAYTPPFYGRGAATAVGMWITFAILVVALGRWSSWIPLFWRSAARLARPLSRLFLPGLSGSPGGAPSKAFTRLSSDPAASSAGEEKKHARRRTLYGSVLLIPALVGLLWQRPEAAASLLVAAAALGAWLAMGLARRAGSQWPLSPYPLRVVTADSESKRPSLAFGIAAGASMVLALSIHAPGVALVPVVLLLSLFAVDATLRGVFRVDDPTARGWVVLGLVVAILLVGAAAFASRPEPVAGAVLLVAAAYALWLRGSVAEASESRLTAHYRGFLELRRAILSGPGWIGALLVLGVLVFLNTQEIPPFVRFALVFTLFLLAIRAGLSCNRVLQRGGRRGRMEAMALLLIPLGVLLVFMLFDFGLGLVFFVPMFITVLLAARIDRLPASLMMGAVGMVAVLALVAGSVLRPSLDRLRAAPDLGSFSEEYATVGNGLVDAMRQVGVSGPITRATVRSMAASDPRLLEEALAFAGPSDALFAAAPSIEQVWGGRAYAASGWTGTGFAGTTPLGRGIPTAVSYAENAFSVYVLSEHGALGGLAVLAVYLLLLVVVGVWIARVHAGIQDTPLGLAVVAMVVGGVLWLTLPAAYVAASNLGVVPLTGQNMPFLGLNSWADVVLVCGLSTGMIFALTAVDPSERRVES